MAQGAPARAARDKAPLGLPERGLQLVASCLNALAGAVRDAAEQRRLFLLWPSLFVLGIIGNRIGGQDPAIALYGLGTLILAAAIWTARAQLSHLRMAGLAGALWLGFCALPLHGFLWGTPMLASPAYGTYTFTLDDVIFDDGEAQRWIISGFQSDDAWRVPDIRRARVLINDVPDVRSGDQLSARIRFYPVPAPAIPGGYDAQFVSYFDGVGAYGNVLGDLEVLTHAATGPSRWADRIRTHISNRIFDILGNRIGGIAAALITGNQSRILEEDRDVMASAGLAHVLAISGLHLTLVAGTVFALVRMGLSSSVTLSHKIPAKKVAAVAGIATATAYLVISGMGVSAIRSTIMLSLIFAAVVAGRQALTMRNVAIAALIIAALDPASIFRASYQLSFAAVIALIAIYELMRDRPGKDFSGPKNRMVTLFVGIASTSIIAGFATLLFTAYHFQQTAPFGLVGNLMAMPIVTFVMMPAALFATLLIPIGLDQPLYQLMGWSIEAVLWCANFVRTLSGGFDPSPILTPASLVVGLVALAWLAFFAGRIKLLGPILAVPIIAIFCTQSAPDVLIADQTQAIAVRHEGHLALISGRNNTFATNVWSERYIEPVASFHETTACGSLGCIMVSSEGFTLAHVRHAAAFEEDCTMADVIIARIEAPTWCADYVGLVIDANDLLRLGTHELRWNAADKTFAAKTAVTDPDRAWRPRR